MRFKIRYADKIVGIFLLFAIAAFVTILIFLGMNQRWFERGVEFSSRFPSANGLNRGMPITLSGFEIGKVRSINLNEQNEVDILFEIYEEYYSRIKEHSIIQLSTPVLGLGGGGLIIHIGKGTDVLPPGSYVPAMDSLEGRSRIASGLVMLPAGTDMVSNILEDAGTALADVPTLITNLNQTLRSLDTVLVDIDQTFKGRTEGPVGDSIVHVNAVLANLEKISEDLQTTTKALSKPDELTASIVSKLAGPGSSINTILNDNNKLYGQLQGMLDSLQTSVKEVQGLASYLNSTRPQILNLLEDTRKTLNQGQDVLEGVKNNPLIRGGIPETPKQTAPFKSYRDGNF